MTTDTNQLNGIFRRTVLNASAVAVGTLGVIAPTTGDEHKDGENNDEADDEMDDDDEGDDPEVDEPDGFEVDLLAAHAPFPDDVAARFCLEYAEDHEGDPVVVNLDDASTVIFGEATWEAGGRSGWHRHPGTSIVNVVEGEVEVTWARDCVPRTYAAGDAWLDHGDVHKADSEDGAVAYACFLGVPDGEPATEWVEPVDC